MKLTGLDGLLCAIGTDLDRPSLQALQVGLLCEAFSGQYRACSVGEVLRKFWLAEGVNGVGLWFDTTTRLAGCAVWRANGLHGVGDQTAMRLNADSLHTDPRAKFAPIVLQDYAAAPGYEMAVARQIERLAYKTHNAVSYTRQRSGGKPSVVVRQLRGRSPQPIEEWQPTRNPGILEARRTSLMRSVELGQFFGLVTASCHMASEPLGQALSRFKTAAQLGQVKFSLAADGKCDAAITWARPTDVALAVLRRRGPNGWHASDWDEGDHLVIIDGIGSASALAELMQELRRRLRGEPVTGRWQLAKRALHGGHAAWDLVALADEDPNMVAVVPTQEGT